VEAAAFSVPFTPTATQEYLLTTADGLDFLIITRDQLALVSSNPVRIASNTSSIDPKPHYVYMLNRGAGFASDPIITVNATGFSNQTVIYCEGNLTMQTPTLSSHFGLNVFIRSPSICRAICTPGCLMGMCNLPGQCNCYGHFTGALCDKCLAGWSGPSCDIPVCSSGCQHGNCLTRWADAHH